MTDCCLCVWCRPAPHRRLVLSLYPPGAKGNEAGLLPVNASKVTQYARARPVFLPTIAKDLCKRAKNDWKRGRIGYVAFVQCLVLLFVLFLVVGCLGVCVCTEMQAINYTTVLAGLHS